MGFGTLFIGYFLLLNLTYYSFTDLIAASVMLLGLYKLSKINKHFFNSAIVSAVFLAFSVGEFGIATYEMFVKPIGSAVVISTVSVVRCLILGFLTILILKGIEAVAKEVDIPDLPTKASRLVIITSVTYAAWIVLEAPLKFINDYVLAVLSLITILATIALLIVNLTVIYTCYMRICMPGDDKPKEAKQSRFAFVNTYRERKAERQAEVQARRDEMIRKRNESKKGKKK